MKGLMTCTVTLALAFITISCERSPTIPDTLPTIIEASPEAAESLDPVQGTGAMATSLPIAVPTLLPVDGAGYGGHYIDPDDDSIVHIYMVNPSQEAADEMGRTHISNLVYRGMQKVREVRPVQALYTVRQLKAWHSLLSRQGLRGTSGWTTDGVSTRLNRILVGVGCESERERFQVELNELTLQAGVPLEAAVLKVQSRAVTTNVDRFECAPPERVHATTGLSVPGFGGLFFESGTINVYMLDPSKSGAEELAFVVLGREVVEESSGVQSLQAQYTWEQLVEWHDVLKESLEDVPGVLEDPLLEFRKNRLVLTVEQAKAQSLTDEVNATLEQLNIPAEAAIWKAR